MFVLERKIPPLWLKSSIQWSKTEIYLRIQFQKAGCFRVCVHATSGASTESSLWIGFECPEVTVHQNSVVLPQSESTPQRQSGHNPAQFVQANSASYVSVHGDKTSQRKGQGTSLPPSPSTTGGGNKSEGLGNICGRGNKSERGKHLWGGVISQRRVPHLWGLTHHILTSWLAMGGTSMRGGWAKITKVSSMLKPLELPYYFAPFSKAAK